MSNLNVVETFMSDLTSALNITAAGPSFQESAYAVYEESTATTLIKEMPRFGHNNDIARLLSADSDHASDYSRGMLFAVLIILVPFFLWSLLLLRFKLCRSKKAGFLSGNPFTIPERACDDGPTLQKWQNRVLCTRAIFVVACTMVPICAKFLVTNGLHQLDSTKVILLQSNNHIQQILNEAIDITYVLSDVADQIQDVTQNEIFQNDEICPGETSSLAQSEGTQYADILQNVQDLRSLTEEVRTFVEDVAQQEIDRFRYVLETIKGHSNQFSVIVRQIDEHVWILWIFLGPLILIPVILILAATLAHFQFMRPNILFVLNWILLPIFVLWICVCIIASSIMAIMSVSNSDFCTGSGTNNWDETPDSSIMLAMHYAGLEQSNLDYQSVRYYVYQCTPRAQEDPFLFLRNVDVKIGAGQSLLEQVTNVTNNQDLLLDLSSICNRDFQPLSDLTAAVNDILIPLRQSSTNTLSLVDCQRIVPIYTNTVYDGVCDNTISGIAWIYFCLVAICCMGMVMITCRSSYHNIVIQEESDEDDDNKKAFNPQWWGAQGSSEQQQDNKKVVMMMTDTTRRNSDLEENDVPWWEQEVESIMVGGCEEQPSRMSSEDLEETKNHTDTAVIATVSPGTIMSLSNINDRDEIDHLKLYDDESVLRWWSAEEEEGKVVGVDNYHHQEVKDLGDNISLSTISRLSEIYYDGGDDHPWHEEHEEEEQESEDLYIPTSKKEIMEDDYNDDPTNQQQQQGKVEMEMTKQKLAKLI